ncbi:MAG: redoxin family protein [Desulfobulbaceae bacterium]|nr:redoxin family protein [Desulfobulbaceae bacterium]
MKLSQQSIIVLFTLMATLLVPQSSLARTSPWDIEVLPTTLAPAFSLPDTDGTPLSSKSFQGKVMLINFWATWCAPCRGEMPALDTLQQEYKGKGLVIIGINIDNDLGQVKQFIKDTNTKFLILHDPEMRTHDSYKVTSYPTTFLVDRKGIIQKYWIGPQEWNSEEFKNTLRNYL